VSKQNNNDINFGKSIAELEEIVAWFESDEVDLDNALQRFERGMELAGQLKNHLQGIENKVEVIKRKFDSSALVAADANNSAADIPTQADFDITHRDKIPPKAKNELNNAGAKDKLKTDEPPKDPLNLF
jgi:exodeoxyribonuclease VII small subunit